MPKSNADPLHVGVHFLTQLGKYRQRKTNIFGGRLLKQCSLISGAFGGRSGDYFWHFSKKRRRSEHDGFYNGSELFSKARSSWEAANVRKRGLRKLMFFEKCKNRSRGDSLRFWGSFRGPVSHFLLKKNCFSGWPIFLRFDVFCGREGPAQGQGSSKLQILQFKRR